MTLMQHLKIKHKLFVFILAIAFDFEDNEEVAGNL